MQATTSKLKTGFVKLGNRGIWLPVPDDILEELGIESETLLKLDFTVRLDENKIVIESIPTREQLSNDSTPGRIRTNQGADING